MLHLVGILFPHINDDARSKPHQTFPLLPQENSEHISLIRRLSLVGYYTVPTGN